MTVANPLHTRRGVPYLLAPLTISTQPPRTRQHQQHLLPLTAARAPEWRAWLPLAFDMEKEAAAFVHEYSESPRLFILKPWNLGRSMDTAVADSLAQALAMAQTCPKVACEYVSDPALVHGKKIDVRCVRTLCVCALCVMKVLTSQAIDRPYGRP